jgi:hypothetical protein
LYRNVTIKNEIIEIVVVNAVIEQNKDQLKNTTKNDTLAAIRNLFEVHQINITGSSTNFFLYSSNPENIHLNITETLVNLSTIIGKILAYVTRIRKSSRLNIF